VAIIKRNTPQTQMYLHQSVHPVAGTAVADAVIVVVTVFVVVQISTERSIWIGNRGKNWDSEHVQIPVVATFVLTRLALE